MDMFEMSWKFGSEERIAGMRYRKEPFVLNFADMVAQLNEEAAAFAKDGGKVARINMDIAPPGAPLGDVRPASSGPQSFGFRVEFENGFVGYFMAEPVS